MRTQNEGQSDAILLPLFSNIWQIIGIGTGLIFGSLSCLAQLPPTTLDARLQQGVAAFSKPNYSLAADIFEQLENEFGQEREYQSLQQTLLPLWGYAAAQAGDDVTAIQQFNRFLEAYPEDPKQQRFVLYSLALAYQRQGEIAAAIEVYQRFTERAPHSPEAALSRMRQAELHFEQGETDKGLELLYAWPVNSPDRSSHKSGIIEGTTTFEPGSSAQSSSVGLSQSETIPSSLQTQAQLRAIQKALETGQEAQAAAWLLAQNWAIETLPDLTVLTFCGLRAGDYLMQQQRIAEAMHLYRLVPPRKQLVAIQRQKLATLEKTLTQRQNTTYSDLSQHTPIWDDYYRHLITRVKSRLQVLKTEADYTPGLQLRLGQAFLLQGRHREAYLLYATLSAEDALDEALRSEAHYRWILSANALGAWDDSLEIAYAFLESYPTNPLAPQALYLIANAYHQQKHYAQAIGLLDDLLERYPEHPLAPRWLFSRGFNQTLAHHFEAAHIDFEAYLTTYPAGFQIAEVRLWEALTWFFEKNYDTALEHFETARQTTPQEDPLYPEIDYRYANTLYAMRDYEAALPTINTFIEQYPKHSRAPEAQVLRGDILMGQGDLIRASNAFQQVSPEAGYLYPYAVFQRGKIMRALETYDLMVEHFQNYVERDDLPEKGRLAEALYWIGWAHSQQDRPEAAFTVFMDVLERHGNDPLAGEIDPILQALHKLHRQYQKGEAPLEAQSAKANELLEADSFEKFLLKERERALQTEALTWFARLNLYLADTAIKQKQTDRAEALLWEIIEKTPPEQLDADGLARLGQQLQEAGFEGSTEYFERLLDVFPRRPQIAVAYYGLARQAVQNQDLVTANRWLQQFQEETAQHPLAPEASLLQARVWIASGRPHEAIDRLESLLRQKQYRGRLHARALERMAEAYVSIHELKKAIACYQRIYTVYRAYPDLLASAYLRSAQLFEQLGDPQSSYETYRELLTDKRLKPFAAYSTALQETKRLEANQPSEPRKANHPQPEGTH